MKSISIFTRSVMALMCIFLLGACASTLPQAARKSTVVPATSTVISVPSPAPATPTPTPPPLGPVPQNCPPGSILHPPLNGFGPVLGGGKVWFDGIDGPHAVIHFTGEEGTFPYGWTRKLVWEVGPPPVGLVTIRGESLRTHQPLWFQLNDQDPIVTSLVLDPQHSNHPVSVVDLNWAEWGSYLFVPAAGCYTLSASWPGGQWRIFFAAGRF